MRVRAHLPPLVAGVLLATAAKAGVMGPPQWAVEDQGIVYCLDKGAIHRIDVENRTATIAPLPPQMQRRELLEIGIFDGFLWVATDSVIANADARYFDWLVYGTGEGAPLPGYAGMAYEGGEVWVAGRQSLGRYDQYAERWTTYAIPGDTLTDIVPFEGQIWLASRTAVARFDAEYEKTRVYRCGTEVPVAEVAWLRRVGDELWGFGAKGIVRYLTSTESWQVVACPDVEPSQVLVQGTQVWILGADRSMVYDTESLSCREPPWMDRVRGAVGDGALYEGLVYLSTDQILAAYEPSGDPAELKGDLRFPGEVDGLIRSPLCCIASTGTRLVGKGDGFLAAYLNEEGQWWVSDVASRAHSGGQGSLIRLGEGLELALWSPPVAVTGVYTYLLQSQHDGGEWDTSDRHRIRLSARSGSASAFVDNTDQLLGDRYGFLFKGSQNGMLRELGAGWGSAEAELMDLTGRPGYRGGRVWLEHGERSPRRGHRPVEAHAWAGERTTRHAEECFAGGAGSYRLAHGTVVIGSVKLYLDDQLLDEGSFTLDHSSGSFFLSFAERDLVTEDSTVRVAYDYWLPDGTDGSVLAGPQIVVNRGDAWTLSLGSLIEREDGQTSPLLSGGLRFRSDPDALRRLSMEGEVLGDPEEGEAGSRAMVSFATDRLDLQLGMHSLPGEIQTEGRAQTEYGPLEREITTSGRVEPSRDLPISWRSAWRWTAEYEGLENDGRLMWAHHGLPALSLDVATRHWEGEGLDTRWRKVELEGDYDPGALPGFDKLRAQLLVRQSTDDQGAASTRYRSGLARMHMRPAGVLDLSLLAWGHRADDVSEGPVERLSSRGSGLLTATSTPLPGLSVYVRGEGDVTSTYADTADTPQSKDVSLDRSILASTVLRPGKAPVELEASYSRSLSDLLSDIDRRDGFSDWLQDVGDSADVRQQRSTVISGGPLLFLPSQSTLRLRAAQTTRTNADSSGVFSSTTQETYSLSLDLRPLTSSRWLAEGSGSVSRADGHESESWNTYARWERRWNQLFLSRLAFTGAVGKGSADTWSWSPSVYVQVGPGRRGLELRGELGAGRRRSTEVESFVRGTFRLELRFLRAFLVRAEVRPEVVFPSSGETETSTVVSLRAGATL